MRVLFVLLALLWVACAAVQLNDPDPWFWLLVYGLAALVGVVEIFRSLPALVYGVVLGLAVGYLVTLVGPASSEWGTGHRDTEILRELGGLVLVSLWALAMAIRALRRRSRLES